MKAVTTRVYDDNARQGTATTDGLDDEVQRLRLRRRLDR